MFGHYSIKGSNVFVQTKYALVSCRDRLVNHVVYQGGLRMLHKRATWFSCLFLLLLPNPRAHGQDATGEVIVRVDDTSGSHCIDADTEKITVFLRRVFTHKSRGLFTEDK